MGAIVTVFLRVCIFLCLINSVPVNYCVERGLMKERHFAAFNRQIVAYERVCIHTYIHTYIHAYVCVCVRARVSGLSLFRYGLFAGDYVVSNGIA